MKRGLRDYCSAFLWENFYIHALKRIEETARRTDLRTVKVLDLFIEAEDKCFVFEENIREKLLKKKKLYCCCENKLVVFINRGKY